ncbi:MAG: radical SAM protein [Nanoarchaeota archaeon]|nr:radical SAM protein [Nanoarchaeota archaeon]
MSNSNIAQRYGNLKIVWHHEKLNSLLENKITAPLYVRIKPTNKCNHNCFYCSYNPDIDNPNILSTNFKRQDEIPQEKMMEILSDFKDIGVKAITYSGGGEPLIYPHIGEAFEKTLDYGIDLSIITNGQKLNGKNAEQLANSKWVRISLDAADQKTFEQTRRVSGKLFYELEENINNFAKIKKPECEFGINFVVNHLNNTKIYEAAKFFKEHGVNHIKFTPRWIEHGWEEYHAPFKESSIEQIKRAQQELPEDNFENRFAIFDTYENDFNMTGVSERKYPKCYIMQTIPVIGADSKVYFCHDKTYTKNGALGSIEDKSFKELWFSEKAKEKFNNFNPKKECQQHCTYDSRNILINDSIRCYGDDLNFI